MSNFNRRKFMQAAAASGTAMTLPSTVAARGPDGDPEYYIDGEDTDSHWKLLSPDINHKLSLVIGEYDWYCDTDGLYLPRTWYDINITTGVYEGDGEDESDWLSRVGMTEILFEWNRDEADPRSPQNDKYLGGWDNYEYHYPEDYDWIEDVVSIGVSAMPAGWVYHAANIVGWTSYAVLSGGSDATENTERHWDFASDGSGENDRCTAYQLVEVEALVQRPTFRFRGQSRSKHGEGGLFPAVEHTYTAYTPQCSGLSSTSTVDSDRLRGVFTGEELLANPHNFNLPPVAFDDIDPDDEIRLYKPKSDVEIDTDIEYVDTQFNEQ